MPLVLDGKYQLGRILGEGGFCQVYEATDETGNLYAVKTWKQYNKKMFEDERKAVELEEHPYLVKYISSGRQAPILNTENNSSAQVTYILMEHVSGGEFLQTLIDHSGFNDEICRYYFKQMLQGMNYLHQSGLAHRDLKPDNMMFTENGSAVKITDFGFMIPLEGRERIGWIESKVGTSSYMAPEVLSGDSYHGKLADIYSLGVILFIMRMGNMPMEVASTQDKQFKCLAGNRPDLFWSLHANQDEHGPIDKDFKELIQAMIHPEASLRHDMADVISSKWMQGPIATKEQAMAEMQRRNDLTAQRAKQNRQKQKNSEAATRRDVDLNDIHYVQSFVDEA